MKRNPEIHDLLTKDLPFTRLERAIRVIKPPYGVVKRFQDNAWQPLVRRAICHLFM
jgi:hypothetical protein